MQDDTFLTKEEKKELKKQKSQKRGERLAGIFVVLMFAGYGIWSVGFGIYGLFIAGHKGLSDLANGVETYAVYEGDLGDVSDLSNGDRVQFYCNLKHTICLIPYAHEYFYFIMLDDMHKVISVRAGKHWGEILGEDSSLSSIPIKGQIRRMDSYKVENLLKEIVESSGDFFAGYEIETDYYIDMTGTKMNVLHMIAGLGILMVLGGGALLVKEEKRDETGSGEQETWIKKSPMPELLLALFIVTAALSLYVLSVG